MKGLIRNMGIGCKFVLMTMIYLFFPILIIFGIVNYFVIHSVEDREMDKTLEILKQSRPSIENMLNDVIILTGGIVADTNVQRLFQGWQNNGSVSDDTVLAVQMYLEQEVYLKKFISSAALFTENMTLYQYRVVYEKEDILEEESTLRQIQRLGGAVYWEPGRIHRYYRAGEKNEAIVSLYRVVNDLYKLTPIGMMRFGISEEYLCSLYNNAGEGKDAYIFDEEGRIVSARDKSALGCKVETKLTDRLAASSGYHSIAGSEDIAFYYRIPDIGWTVVKIISRQEIMKSMYMFNPFIWTMFVLAMLFCILYFWVLHKTVIRPVVQLARDVEKFDEGNYEIKIYTDSRDEVGQLNQSVVDMANHIRDLIETVYKSQIMMQEAELLSLQAQINPHFLYNTLDTMRWIAMEHGEREIAVQINALSEMFRHVLNNGQEETTIREEVNHLQNYLKIQECRFGDKIQVSCQIDESLYRYSVLKLILQPLVENAFVHGLENKVGKGMVNISVEREGDDILYKVKDDGIGTDGEKIRKILTEPVPQTKVYGLKNVHDRIQLKYGSQYGILFWSEIGKGTEVWAKIPGCLKEDRE